MRNGIITLLVTLTIFIGCKPKLSSEELVFFNSFSNYMFNKHKVVLNNVDNQSFYIFQLEGCNPCVQRNIELLFSKKIIDLTLVIVGETKNKEYLEKLNQIKSNYNHFIDIEKEIFSYETNLYKPFLVKIKKGNCTYYRNIFDSSIKNLESIVIND